MRKLNPDATALLVIDMQRAFVDEGAALCIGGARATVPFLNQTINDARKAGIKIIWIKREYSPDYSDMEESRKNILQSKGIENVLAPGSKGINSGQEPLGLVRLPGETVIVKKRFSAFFDTKLNEELQKNGIETLILTGTTTPNCIRSTCYDALSYNYGVIIFEPCCSSATPEIQEANIKDMENVGAEIWYEKDINDAFSK